ncbi:MAG: Cys-tRNA(Pro) deacylase [Ignavibacteria bacterium]|nr:Cys-tRNA(Pro) deacylase [Ignavibacteria bacterium]
MSKTNAIRILELAKIPYSFTSYEYNEDEIDAVSVAKKINVSPDTVFKTLVTTGDKTGITIFIIPGNSELNTKKAALASGNKKIEMLPTKDLLTCTGYIRGGCSPIGMKKKYPSFIEETSQLNPEIYVSAGIRGMQIKISPADLCNVIGGKFADLI